MIMGCKAEGAAQGYTVLGGIVLLVYSLNMMIQAVNGAIGGDLNSLVDFVLGVALLLMTILSFDACGFVYWKVQRSGPLLALFGLIAIFIVNRSPNFDIISWIMNLGSLAGFMILLAGLLLIFKS